MRPGIGSQHLQATRKTPLEAKLERVVVRYARVVDEIAVHIWIGGRRNKVGRLQQTTSGCTDVGGSEGLLLSQRLLPGNIPFQSVWKSELRIEGKELRDCSSRRDCWWCCFACSVGEERCPSEGRTKEQALRSERRSAGADADRLSGF